MSIFHLAPEFFDRPFMLARYEIKDLRTACQRIFDETSLSDYKEYLGNALEECAISGNAPFEEGSGREEAFTHTFMIMKVLDIVKHIADGAEVPAVLTPEEQLDEHYSNLDNLNADELKAAFTHFNDRALFFSRKYASMATQGNVVLKRLFRLDVSEDTGAD